METTLTDIWINFVAILVGAIATYFASKIQSRAALEAKTQAMELKREEAILEINNEFRVQIKELKTAMSDGEKRHDAEKLRWQSSNKELSDELTAQLEGQARERADMRQQVAEYQGLLDKQGHKMELQDQSIQELSTKVTGFKTLADQVVLDRNNIKAELDKTTADLETARKTIEEKDNVISALTAEKEALILKFEDKINQLIADLEAKDKQIQELIDRVQALELQNRLEDTQPKPEGLTQIIAMTPPEPPPPTVAA